MRNINGLLAMLLCLCLLAPCAALGEATSAPVEAAPVEAEIELQPDAPEGDRAVSAVAAGDDLPKGSGVKLDKARFPDANFRAFVAAFDQNGDGALSDGEIKAVKSIDCADRDIASLKGIEYFTELVDLCCDDNRLTKLDLSKNAKLKKLTCEYNRLTGLNTGKNGKLEELDCHENSLKSLDLQNNKKLKRLVCNDNKIKKLDLSKNAKLELLICYHNSIASCVDVYNSSRLVKCIKSGKKEETSDYVWYTLNDDNYIWADSSVRFSAAKVKKVAFAKGTGATLYVGDKTTLKVKYTPAVSDSDLTWKTSDKKVATVSEKGVVTAKKKGTATITATTANGKQAKIKITVKAKRTDLLYYIGKDIYAVARQFGIKKVEPLAYDEGSLTGRGSKIQLYAYRNSPKIDDITCQQKGFTACGVECGMKYETAYEKAMQYFAQHGYAITYEVGSDDPYDVHMEIYGENPGAGVPRIGLAFWQENGKVSSVSISVWGD